MGNKFSSMNKINFEDVQTAYKKPEIYLLINTLADSEQTCLITNTIHASNEESLINKYIQSNKNISIIIYGKNTNDEGLFKKYTQLQGLGFTNLYIYLGGLFEWLLLQDIYGRDEFPTTTKELDFLKFKPRPQLEMRLLLDSR